MCKRTILFGLIVAFSVTLGFVSFRDTPSDAVSLVRRFGYWHILLSTILFGVCVVRSLSDEVKAAVAAWRAWLVPAVMVLAAAAFLHVHEPHEYKIVMDEVVLQDTAMRMHFDREAGVMVRGYDLAGNFLALHVYVDKRPLFFPFLLATFHDIAGYRVENVFYLNAVLSAVFLGVVFLTGRRLGGNPAGYAGVLLVASIPLVHQNATSSGFELLNLVMIAVTLWFGMRFAERPENRHRLGAFLLSAILLAQTRYESALFIIPVGAIVLYTWWRRKAPDFSWPILLAPVLLVIVPLHYNVFRVAATAWQLADRPGADVPFHPRYFYDNVGHAMNFFFSLDGSQANSPLVAVLGLVGIGFFAMTLCREHRSILHDQPGMAAFCVFIVGLCVQTGLMLCYFWGQFDDPIIRRLSLPTNLLMVLAFIFVLPRLVSHAARWRVVIGATLLFIVGFTVPSVAEHRYNKENFAARTNSWLADFIERLGERSVLAIDSATGLQWLIHRKSSVPPAVIAARPEALLFHFKNKSFSDFFVVQRMGADFDHGTRFPTVDDDVGEGLKLEVVDERSFSPAYYIRVSRIVAIDEEKLRAWSVRRGKVQQLSPAAQAAIQREDSKALDRWFQMLP